MTSRYPGVIPTFFAALSLCACTTPAPKPEAIRPPEASAESRTLDAESVAPIALSSYLLDGDLCLEVRTPEGTGYRIARG